jgi:hypothetical protein
MNNNQSIEDQIKNLQNQLEEKKNEEKLKKENQSLISKELKKIKIDLPEIVSKDQELSKDQILVLSFVVKCSQVFDLSSQIVGNLGSVLKSNGKKSGRMGSHVMRLKENPDLIPEIKNRYENEGIGRHSLGLEYDFGVSSYNIVSKIVSGDYDYLLES